jgi:nucleotide-binding universal stress UspA family protein
VHPGNSNTYINALTDFKQARQQAAMQEVLARFTRKSTSLLPFDEAYKRLHPTGMADRGLKEIPIDAIVGSVNRYTDFTSTFLPKHDSDAQRWATVKSLATAPGSAGLPPIQVYKIGDAYFVSDGNHRVSVAKQLGSTSIEAYVTEVQTRVPLSASANFEELITKAEYADFLDKTRLDVSRPNADLTMTEPGQYIRLEEQIETYREAMKDERAIGGDTADVPFTEVATRWYDEVYLPVVATIRDRGVLRDFPGRTETDLYIWILEHRDELENELGWEVQPGAAAEDLVTRSGGTGILSSLADGPAPGHWREARIENRYTDVLFRDILVPLSGEELNWQGLQQALLIAKREGSRIKGLRVVGSEAEREAEAVEQMRELFDRYCAEAGVDGTLAVEVGDVAATICNRAVLADLVVLNLAHPPTNQLFARFSHGIRTIIRRCARPVLAVPGITTPLSNVLLSYDGSPKAKEALFVATYLAEQWKSAISVLVVKESEEWEAALTHARRYLEMHEIAARFVEHEKAPPAEVLMKLCQELGSDLIVMGGYGSRPVVEVVVGSAVDQVLRESEVPMLICR